jgi:D-erythrose 4-phosphate dehydrogenase
LNAPLPVRIGINGYGRIGRCFLRVLHERGDHPFAVVAINEPADLESMAYLTRFDSTHGRFPWPVKAEGDGLQIGSQRIAVSHATQPEGLNWAGLNVDLLIESSGRYTTRTAFEALLAGSGAPRLLISHPAHSAGDVDATVVFGHHAHTLTPKARLVSNASCTTNALVPVLSLLETALGLDHVQVTTLHSVMNDQPLIDGYHHADLRRTRSAMSSLIPVSTELAKGVERLLPALAGRVQAKAIRVPTLNVSALDVVILLGRETDTKTLNALLREAAQGPLKGLVACSDEPHASIDFNHDPHSAIVDLSQTRVSGGHLANLFIWFDNEWGFVNRMLDVACYWQTLWPAQPPSSFSECVSCK